MTKWVPHLGMGVVPSLTLCTHPAPPDCSSSKNPQNPQPHAPFLAEFPSFLELQPFSTFNPTVQLFGFLGQPPPRIPNTIPAQLSCLTSPNYPNTGLNYPHITWVLSSLRSHSCLAPDMSPPFLSQHHSQGTPDPSVPSDCDPIPIGSPDPRMTITRLFPLLSPVLTPSLSRSPTTPLRMPSLVHRTPNPAGYLSQPNFLFHSLAWNSKFSQPSQSRSGTSKSPQIPQGLFLASQTQFSKPISFLKPQKSKQTLTISSA